MTDGNILIKERAGRLPARFFSRFGVFVQPNFLDAQTCANLRDELETCPSRSSTVLKANGKAEVDTKQRPAKHLTVSHTTKSWVEQRLHQVKPELEKYFHCQIVGFATPRFLVYKPGDYHVPHLDKNDRPEKSLGMRLRQFAVLIYLNSEGELNAPAAYGGGALTLYGLLDEPVGKKFGFPLRGEEGMLVAFPVSLLHEVTTITHGNRYCMLSHAY